MAAAYHGTLAAMGIERYEYDDGTTTKFFEIELAGAKLVQRWGKVGGSTSSNEKTFADAAKARAEADKAIKKKTADGFTAVGGKKKKAAKAEPAATKPAKPAKAAKAAKAGNAEIEQLLADKPDDKGTWQVYADALLEAGEPWGEMIVKHTSGKKPKQLAEVEAELLGELDGASITWKHGVIESIDLQPEENPEDTAGEQLYYETLRRILSHPAGRLVRKISLGLPPLVPGDIHWNMTPLVKVIGECGPLPLLAELDMSSSAEHMDQESWRSVGNLKPLWKAAPRLAHLHLFGSSGSDRGSPIDMGTIDAPYLETLTYKSSGLSSACPVAIGKASLPNLTKLELYLGDDNYGNTCTPKSFDGILAGTGLPKLVHLGLKNAKLADKDEKKLIEALARSPLVKRLKTLDLSLGTLYAEAATALVANAAAFRHLQTFDLSDNYFTDEQVAEIQRALPKADLEAQKELEEPDEPDYRYPTVGE